MLECGGLEAAAQLAACNCRILFPNQIYAVLLPPGDLSYRFKHDVRCVQEASLHLWHRDVVLACWAADDDIRSGAQALERELVTE